MKSRVIFFFLLILPQVAMGVTFKQAVEIVKNHTAVKSLQASSKEIKKVAGVNGSWGDPEFKMAAKNYPKSSLRDDQTPMTGIEFELSQKISLTTKYKSIRNSIEAMAKAKKYASKDKENFLIKNLWEMIIRKKKIAEEITILKENIAWIGKILKVSKRLYANGKTSQQAILDMQIRKSEIEGNISNKKFEFDQTNDVFEYLLGKDNREIEKSTIPWGILEGNSGNKFDFKELGLKEVIGSAEYGLAASKLNYIPDVTLSVSYTKRKNVDGYGDFVSAAISFPLPFSGKKYSKHDAATQKKYQAIRHFEHYKNKKARDEGILNSEITKIATEIKIIDSKTIKFARNSRTITSKSYGHGNSTYVELLQSELKLQNILLKRVHLAAVLMLRKIGLKYISGEKLYE